MRANQAGNNVHEKAINGGEDTRFVPPGYLVLRSASGDANMDGWPDRILVLNKETEASTSDFAGNDPEERPFLLLLGQPDGTERLAFRNDFVIDCIDCGGAFGDPFMGISIRGGEISIKHGIAGGAHWEVQLIFAFVKEHGKWVLKKRHSRKMKFNESGNPDNGALRTERDVTSGIADFGTISLDTFNGYHEFR